MSTNLYQDFIGEIVDPPVVDPPVADPPVVDPPVADPPVVDPPVADPPVVDPPVADPPVVDPSLFIYQNNDDYDDDDLYNILNQINNSIGSSIIQIEIGPNSTPIYRNRWESDSDDNN